MNKTQGGYTNMSMHGRGCSVGVVSAKRQVSDESRGFVHDTVDSHKDVICPVAWQLIRQSHLALFKQHFKTMSGPSVMVRHRATIFSLALLCP